MKFKFFTVNALNPNHDQELLNGFCAEHSLISVEKHFVSAGLDSFWALCIQYNERGAGNAQIKKPKIDYREVLSETDFAIYSKLRSLRKSLAEKEGTPVYSIFTNEQLATMVRERIMTESAMLGIDGVGRARVDKYAGEFLPLLQTELAGGKSNEADEN